MLDKIHSFTHKKEEKGNTITLYDIKVNNNKEKFFE